MASIRRQVIVLALLAACSDEPSDNEVDSPCKAFAPAPEPVYELEAFASVGNVRQIVSGAKTYALDDAGKVHLLGESPSIAIHLGAGVRAIAVSADALFALRGQALVRFDSKDGGATFDPAATTLASIPGEGGALAEGDGKVWVATPDGKILRIRGSDVSTFATGLGKPTAIDVDPSTHEVWVVAGGIVERVIEGRSYAKGFAPPVAKVDATSVAVHRGGVAPLAGKVLVAPDVAAIVPYGPSGPAEIRPLGMSARAVGRGSNGELLVATETNVMRVKDIAPAAPKSLRDTGCIDPAGAIAYDVASPLWSDGAEKERMIVVPKGGRGQVLADGDLRLPVGTVAVKTFSVGGRKVETRLLVQHALGSWTGYSYAWNEAGTDAELVVGNRRTETWYFPSNEDCTACHTAAAGYTLGLEARQIATSPDAVAAMNRKLAQPIDRFTALPNGTVEERARSYLHANCSMCHREGSSTGAAELDLRADTALERTGLCGKPQAGSLGIADPRILASADPARSVLLQRMKSLDPATRMPKLASHVVDRAAALLIEEWIQLRPCP